MNPQRKRVGGKTTVNRDSNIFSEAASQWRQLTEWRKQYLRERTTAPRNTGTGGSRNLGRQGMKRGENGIGWKSETFDAIPYPVQQQLPLLFPSQSWEV